ncbi:hypothetical protein LBW62_08165 [Ralstonia solanacearum]|uniref:hypothetical protein n=1 Tax=Ralstonia solanacearum TaxID=305 RepID=UPI0005C77D0C|nr:hypothetical protein [Ralstonia solanacearum]MBB6592752.1 hypothetical protein [Ralstonia solanacearum]MBB6596974.1 hypothetical protein [Ralstonia solanacearum]MDB0541218.1 hypothetical protein [Ralstonia solanacearum]MDB0551408.1 hypothetical protein [Ralstonia solanacearum]MDB0556167.1 hypothetical protein [Ralstonia solanacearum]
MAFAILPFAAIMLLFGLGMQASQLADSVPGAGLAGQMETRSLVSSQQAAMFGTACLNAAIAQPGAVSPSIAVTLPAGVLLPLAAVCMTMSNGSGRNVYAYLPAAPGAAGRLLADSLGSGNWFAVRAAGVAVNLSVGNTMPVPATIPVGSLLNWTQTSS